MEENELISLLAKNNSKAQKYLYDKYAAKYNAICLRYLKEIMLAEDALISGFMKIFTKINQYNKSTNFEAWMYKIMINECLMELRKKSNFNLRLENFQIENIDPMKSYVSKKLLNISMEVIIHLKKL